MPDCRIFYLLLTKEKSRECLEKFLLGNGIDSYVLGTFYDYSLLW